MTNYFVASKSKHFKCFVFLILMFVVSLQSSAQTTVTGIISDMHGPVPGANVNLKGSNSGVSTDYDGKYSINNVPSNGVLVFSFLGYKNKEVSVSGRNTINVVLEEESNSLKEIVVIGYGAQRKEAVTGSVSSIRGADIREVPSANVTQALQGRLAGVQISQTSTKPGSTMQIRVRGTRSLTAGNDPLVVLDGIPFSGTLADISPENIKSIDILKDASATAIYGSRGANGVILVSSNRGTKGQKVAVAYNTYTGLKTAVKYPMMEGPKYAEFRKYAGKNLVNGADESDDVNTDWQDLFYRDAIVTNHDVAVTGGTENGNYSVGVNYYKDQAVMPGSEYNRYAIRAAIDQELGILRLGFSTNSNFSITDGAGLGMYGVLSMSPIANPYNEDGSQKRTVKMPQDEQWVYTRESMNNLGDKWVDRSKAFGSYNSLYAELKIPAVDGLKARVNLGGNYRNNNSGTYTGIGVFSSDPKNPNNASVGNSLSTSWTVESLLTYDHTFAKKHKVNALAMYSSAQDSYNSSLISRKNIAGDNFQYFNLAQTSTGSSDDISIKSEDQTYTQSGLLSYMARAMYSYDDRYMVSATVRSDASSRLAPSNQWHTYPAFSAGWNISKEGFMQNVKWINSLKLRGGYGETSNQSVAPYATLGVLSTRPYNFGSTNAIGNYVTTLPNSNLGWEYSITTNLGLDFSILNNRLSGTAEYYTTDTKDLLLSVGLPVTSGVNSYVGNVGSTQNKGWELSLNGVILDNYNGWTWDAGVNFYGNKNKLVSLASGRMEDKDNWWFVGKPLNVIYDYEKLGLYQTDAEAKLYEGAGGAAGMIKVKYTGDYNADGTPKRLIGADDRQVLNADPDFQGGFNTHVGYKGFDLSIVGLFQSGGILNSTLYGSNGYLNINDGRRGQIDVDYWTPTNTDAQFPKPGGPTESNNPKYGSTLGYFDGSFVKLKTITLGYSLNKEWIKTAGMEKLKLYCTIQNPWVIYSPYHKLSGLDPETNSYANDGSNMAVAYDKKLSRLLTVGYNTPQSRNLILGLNIIF
ncbi:TonB-dependent receptor [Flavobacterium sp. 5]|uniref:SusC/RagA family TonB-linked outer membrane protein n=1 Tax=Flavobacterium sp. 5 TaxID=2035199 RepID=UPI000C2CAEF7|nr:TonB-dependent receptor [Flavobacterium sp. 5]PKB18273.1 TonB-linked SusC/RagA family outer membrane protein [Flavobacterium sp. 5]